VREALGKERKLTFTYADKEGRRSTRIVWPVAVGFFDNARMLAAWCETRAAFRHFRLDRMAAVAVLDERLPRARRPLLRDWRRAEGFGE
jgi:predicted DNA-binding transcriptional regulator YafY